MTSTIPSTLEEYRAQLTKEGYRDLDDLDGLRVGSRVRHRAELWPEAELNGTAVVRLLMEKPDSPWSKTYGQRDIEMIVERDSNRVLDRGNPFTQWANYHAVLIPSSASAGPTRAEHLAWCKKRAIAELDAGSPSNALASIMSDLRKHPGTADHAGLELGGMLMLAGHLSTDRDVRDWIDGIN